jgi:hypothetical protein
MTLEPGSPHLAILEALCAMPRPVRGIALPMIERRFGSRRALMELARAGLVRERGWHAGSGGVWIPTAEGEALLARLNGSAHEPNGTA